MAGVVHAHVYIVYIYVYTYIYIYTYMYMDERESGAFGVCLATSFAGMNIGHSLNNLRVTNSKIALISESL